MTEAGFTLAKTVAVQGPGWLAKDFTERWADQVRRKQLMDLVRAVEHERAVMGVSPHIMTVARK